MRPIGNKHIDLIGKGLLLYCLKKVFGRRDLSFTKVFTKWLKNII